MRVPPIKTQGIKTKLVPFLMKHIHITEKDIWVEPFMGSGVVGFNFCPKRAIFSDINEHIIRFYSSLKDGVITSDIVREYLVREGKLLSEEYYKEVRKRFNEKHSPLDFLFLNRSCFNGLMRFNKREKYNVPYCHKDNRFSKAYITKIVNQVKWVEEKIKENDWIFENKSFEEVISKVSGEENAVIYCDPPYLGRSTEYYGGSWTEDNEKGLKEALSGVSGRVYISSWESNQYRKNEAIEAIWGDYKGILHDHFYHLGGKEENRNKITEILLEQR